MPRKTYYGTNQKVLGRVIRKHVSFNVISKLLDNDIIIKPTYQGALIEDKIHSMVNAYLKNPDFIHLKDMITIGDLNGNLYIIDGQHRLDMASTLWKEHTVDDFLVFNYYKLKTEGEALEIFRELNKDSVKNQFYIDMDIFLRIKINSFKREMNTIHKDMFSKRKTIKGKRYCLEEVCDRLTEIGFFDEADTGEEIYMLLMEYNKLFIEKYDYSKYLLIFERIFYKDEIKCIESNFVVSLKNTNFFDFVLKYGTIEPVHTLKFKRKRITKIVRDKVWKKEYGTALSGKCPIPNCLNVIEYNNKFHCGHIISALNGGENTVQNLRPICEACNLAMGSTNWDEYVDKLLL